MLHATNQHKYRAFISYSSKDTSSAQWWHKRLENYSIPPEFQSLRLPDGHLAGAYLRPIFRDRDELAGSSHLAPDIQSALAQSTFLIVLCSPNSAKSEWVEKEILEFRKLHPAGRVLAVITAGEPNATSNPSLPRALECFPPSLRLPEEPLAADIRPEGDGKYRALIKIVSGITGIEFDQLYRRHERAQSQKRLVFGSIITLIILALTILTIYARSKQISAEIAEQKALQSARSEKFQREKTEVARAAADKVINTMIFDLREKLTDKDLTPVLDKILHTSREYWKSFPPGETLTDERNNARINTLSESIVALRKQGNFAEAIEIGNQATNLGDQFIRENPFSPFAHRARLAAYLEHGVTHLEANDPTTAQKILSNARKTAHTLHDIDPSPLNAWHLACIEEHLGKTHFALEDYEKSILHSQAALKLANFVYEDEPSDQNARLVVSVHENIGKTHLKTQDYPNALKAFQLATPIIKAIYDKDPTPKNARNLSVIHQNLGITNIYLGNTEKGLAHLNELTSINQKIYTKNPSQQNRLNLAIAHEILARTHADLDDIGQALNHAEDNLALSEKIHNTANTPQSLNRLLDAHQLIIQIHPIDETVINHHQIILNLLSRQLQTPNNLRSIIDQHDSLAQLHINLKQINQAITHLKSSLTNLKIINTANPTQLNTYDLAVGHQNLANILLEPQNPITAEKALNNLIEAKKLLSSVKNPDQDTKNLLTEIKKQIQSPTFLH